MKNSGSFQSVISRCGFLHVSLSQIMLLSAIYGYTWHKHWDQNVQLIWGWTYLIKTLNMLNCNNLDTKINVCRTGALDHIPPYSWYFSGLPSLSKKLYYCIFSVQTNISVFIFDDNRPYAVRKLTFLYKTWCQTSQQKMGQVNISRRNSISKVY